MFNCTLNIHQFISNTNEQDLANTPPNISTKSIQIVLHTQQLSIIIQTDNRRSRHSSLPPVKRRKFNRDSHVSPVSGNLDKAPWPASAHGRPVDLHVRSEIHEHPQSNDRGLDPPDPVSTAKRQRSVWMSSRHNAPYRNFHDPLRCR